MTDRQDKTTDPRVDEIVSTVQMLTHLTIAYNRNMVEEPYGDPLAMATTVGVAALMAAEGRAAELLAELGIIGARPLLEDLRRRMHKTVTEVQSIVIAELAKADAARSAAAQGAADAP